MEKENFLSSAQNICTVHENMSLAPFSTFKIGGKSKLTAFPETERELCDIYSLAKSFGIKTHVIGNASNILFSTDGVKGLLIFTEKLCDISVSENTIHAMCGAKLSSLCIKARDHGLGGAEFAFGIPGTVGGAVYMNAGAYGGEISAILSDTLCFDTEKEELVRLSREDHLFGYRKSVLQKGTLIALSSRFALSKSKRELISEKMKEYAQKRRASQPLDLPNAGSIFKRPKEGFAGKYIEDAGLKGYTIGGAQISQKHAGFIVNTGKATSHDVLELIEKTKTEVFRKFGVMLETEIIYIE